MEMQKTQEIQNNFEEVRRLIIPSDFKTYCKATVVVIKTIYWHKDEQINEIQQKVQKHTYINK